MSNLHINEQDQLVDQTPNQINPGAAKPSDFVIEDRDGGQCGDTKAERAALLALSNADNTTTLGEPLAARNEVPKWVK
ncbi:MAG: hypothetical protein WB762_03650 [Candidatus Sulfotelmatobacter sp.]